MGEKDMREPGRDGPMTLGEYRNMFNPLKREKTVIVEPLTHHGNTKDFTYGGIRSCVSNRLS